MSHAQEVDLPYVTAHLAYLGPTDLPIEHRVYPITSGIQTVRPPIDYQHLAIHDARPRAAELDLDREGFALHRHVSNFAEFYDDAAVKARYYPEVADFVCRTLGAVDVTVFDHNTRSAVRAKRGDSGIRLPVDAVHNDYTDNSGPKRSREILADAGKSHLLGRRFLFVNLWRPIVGPVRDNPLAVCDARSVRAEDIVDTPIHHFGEDDLTTPRHSGQIQSIRYSPGHRWYYISEMQPFEVLFLKCFDSLTDGRARFMPHTGFKNPDCPPEFIPRESIEARTLVIM
ncbi:MAG: methyltransferase [Gammaproteobacteria bacterium]|nr:methyltransferase [Gammaproteobacteria bacterium]